MPKPLLDEITEERIEYMHRWMNERPYRRGIGLKDFTILYEAYKELARRLEKQNVVDSPKLNRIEDLPDEFPPLFKTDTE